MANLTHLGHATALALGIALLASPVEAQRARSIEISAFYGGYWGSDVYAGQVNATGPVVNVGANSATGYGARLGYNFKPTLGLEFTWSTSDPSLNFSSAGFTGSKPTGNLKVNNFDFDVNFMFGRQKIWGYFAIGLGWSDFSPAVTYLGAPVALTAQRVTSSLQGPLSNLPES